MRFFNAVYKAFGFDSIDIFADPYDTIELDRRLIKDECDRQGLPIVSVAPIRKRPTAA